MMPVPDTECFLAVNTNESVLCETQLKLRVVLSRSITSTTREAGHRAGRRRGLLQQPSAPSPWSCDTFLLGLQQVDPTSDLPTQTAGCPGQGMQKSAWKNASPFSAGIARGCSNSCTTTSESGLRRQSTGTQLSVTRHHNLATFFF